MNGIRFVRNLVACLALALCAASASAQDATSATLKVAYSDWPGWIAWDIGIQKGWFKEAGVDVEFEWMEYVASMDAFSGGKVDAVCMTNGDAMVIASTGGKPSKGIVINDFSNGNDMVIAKPGIESMKDLKGKKIGVETGFVDHLLLLKGLEMNGLSESDVELVNTVTAQTPQTLASGEVDAIAAWQPNSGAALKALPGSKPVFTSKDAPGLIYDLRFVSPESLSAHREEWKKVVKVWFKIADYMQDPKNKEEMLTILGARVEMKPKVYAPLLAGTAILDLEKNLKAYTKGDGLDSVYGSTKVVDDFNVKNKVYEKPADVDSFLDPSLVEELAKEANK